MIEADTSVVLVYNRPIRLGSVTVSPKVHSSSHSSRLWTSATLASGGGMNSPTSHFSLGIKASSMTFSWRSLTC